MTQPAFIPGKILRDDYIEAIRPLLDLLGIGPMDLFDEIHIQGGRISLNLAASAERLPAGESVEEDDARYFAEYAIPVSIEVVG